ncbi:family 1 glycosylhydrolase [Telluribacter sp.]|jgi:dTDP-4-dehydrorhamnose reductase|uniref:family 1 glycosylhydrolase n=1 Tax=Telluribacter sp. TaxID=1978767 RepID=UPI002E0D8225|nr:family 1 glycosylhydrolase [Telluribacter sp.]
MLNSELEIWGGIECTINRIGNQYVDQLEYAGHYTRDSDLDQIADLGIKTIRYPVLWEKHQPIKEGKIDWSFAESRLAGLQKYQIEPIVGLVHHGSGPDYVNFFDGSFEHGLADYARQVALKFPWVSYYTPVNEPLTTARFCGLYGYWYPHGRDDFNFVKVLVSECKATVMAMQAIRQVNPAAQLVFTEDLGKTYSTAMLRYQADFENQRRWISFDLVAGKVNAQHPLWEYLLWAGAREEDLYFFLTSPCPPDIIGLNYYITSERYLDEALEIYPAHTHGGNGRHNYADVEAVRVQLDEPSGPYTLIREVWERYQSPLAVTEVHLHCTREEQVRWFFGMWKTACQLKQDGVAIQAITAWALLGSFGWNNLLTDPPGDYEPGVFKLMENELKPTALARLIPQLICQEGCQHPILEGEGWWQSEKRFLYQRSDQPGLRTLQKKVRTRPLLILGKTGTLGEAFVRVCTIRGIYFKALGRAELDITNREALKKVLKQLDPWAVVNATGYVLVEQAETDADNCIECNAKGPGYLAEWCEKLGIKLLSFSSDLVFDGSKKAPYVESDPVAPLNTFGKSKVLGEQSILQHNPASLVVRTSTLFGPWDSSNFIVQVLNHLQSGEEIKVPKEVYLSPTYLPDLVNTSLDLLLDEEEGIWHLCNSGQTSWLALAEQVAERKGEGTSLIKAVPLGEMPFSAPRPDYTVLQSEKGIVLPSLDYALSRFFSEYSAVPYQQ